MELSFDDYLSARVKLGRHQIISFFILSMIEFMQGFQEIFVGIQTKILTEEWNLSETQQMVLGSCFYAGVMIGNSVCSMLADIAGRRVMLQLSQSLTIATILLNSWAQTYFEVLMSQFAYGLLFGISMPISQVVISEIVPLRYRGRFIVLLQLIYICGILYLTGCCFIFLDSFSSGDWRSLLRINAIPASLCLLGSMVFLRESPRLYIAQGRYEKGFIELDGMGRKNDASYIQITESEQTGMKLWRETILKDQMDGKGIGGMFEGYNLRITLTIWAIFICFNVISAGIAIITPYVLDDADEGFLTALYSYGAEIPAILLVFVLIDNEKYGGRTRCTIAGLVMLIIVQLAIWYYKQSFVTAGFILQRFSIRIVWSCLNALPAESYSTVYRSMGVGAAQGIGKVSASLSPYAILQLYYYQHYSPFLCCAGICLLTLGFVLSFPINATLRPLDRRSSTQGRDRVSDSISQHEIYTDDPLLRKLNR